MKRTLKYPQKMAKKDAKDNQAYLQAYELVKEKFETEIQNYKNALQMQKEAIETLISSLETEKNKVHLKAGYQSIELRISELLEQARFIKDTIILPQK